MAKQKLITKKKTKKKEKKKFSYGKPKYEKLNDDVEELKYNISKVMRKHVGEENAISPLELFEKVYGVNPLDVEYYKRYFLWNVVKKVLIIMRREDDLYIINKASYLFVLKSERELENHHNYLEANIKGLRKSQKRAKEWVENKKWKYI